MESTAFWYFYEAKRSGYIYPIEIGHTICKVKDLIYEPDKVWHACAIGCSNYNRAGGCPPRAPSVKKITTEEDVAWLIYSRFWSAFKHDNIKLSNNPAIHWKFQDAILARFLANIGYNLVELAGGKFLSTGYCMGCAGRKCNFKMGIESCRNPQKRTYSMEATGINVVQTMKNIFDINLYWYKKGLTNIPYMVKCITVLPSKDITKTKEDFLLGVVNSLSTCHVQVGSAEYHSRLKSAGLDSPTNYAKRMNEI